MKRKEITGHAIKEGSDHSKQCQLKHYKYASNFMSILHGLVVSSISNAITLPISEFRYSVHDSKSAIK